MIYWIAISGGLQAADANDLVQEVNIGGRDSGAGRIKFCSGISENLSIHKQTIKARFDKPVSVDLHTKQIERLHKSL